MKIVTATLLIVMLAGCAAVEPVPGAREPGATGADDDARLAQQGTVEPGHGTLRQDEFTMSLRSDALLVKVTPLTEQVILLAAPDTYERLHALASSRAPEVNASIRSPELFLVSFFSYQPDVTFQPEDVQITHQGRLLRPEQIMPLNTGWGRQRLAQQETQSAVYVFEGSFDYDQPIAVAYGLQRNDDWSRIANRLRVELGKVRARAGS